MRQPHMLFYYFNLDPQKVKQKREEYCIAGYLYDIESYSASIVDCKAIEKIIEKPG